MVLKTDLSKTMKNPERNNRSKSIAQSKYVKTEADGKSKSNDRQSEKKEGKNNLTMLLLPLSFSNDALQAAHDALLEKMHAEYEQRVRCSVRASNQLFLGCKVSSGSLLA